MSERVTQRERFENREDGFTAEVACSRCGVIVVFLNPSIDDWYKPLCLRCYRTPVEGCDEIGTEVRRG